MNIKSEAKKTRSNKKRLKDYLKEPYTRIVIPDSETGTFTAEILEFPGCIAEGKSIQEAYDNLEKAADGWITAALELGQTIPPPSIIQGAGGKIVLRLPKNLHRQLIRISEREGTSLNQFILSAISEKVGAMTLYDNLAKRIENRIMQYQTTAGTNTRIPETINTLNYSTHTFPTNN